MIMPVREYHNIVAIHIIVPGVIVIVPVLKVPGKSYFHTSYGLELILKVLIISEYFWKSCIDRYHYLLAYL